MIVVDTSIWVAAERRPTGPEAQTLRALLDVDEVALALPVRLELMAGVVKQKNRVKVKLLLSAVPVLVPTEDTWRLIESWVGPAADAGHYFQIADLLIAGLTNEIGGLVWSTDTDFADMEKLGFVQLYG